jgi:alkanesulfonate monooxygenase SsuD/methylene tetrahydromethanopterin reductase-like flavin-dependent oxidoreductase (luciferase family)
VKLGLQLNSFDWTGAPERFGAMLIEIAVAAEEAGFDRIGVADHVWQHPIVGGPEADAPECYATLSFLAANTERVMLTAMVSGIHFRHPAVLVKSVTTLDVLSGGRAWLGIGSGHYEEETRGLGIPFPPQKERFEMLEETAQIALRMWSGDRGDERPFEGKHYHLERPLNLPQSIARPRRREEDAAPGRPLRRRLQPAPRTAGSRQARRVAPPLRRRGTRLRGDREDLRVRLRRRREGREGGRVGRAPAPACRDGCRDRDRHGPERGSDHAAGGHRPRGRAGGRRTLATPANPTVPFPLSHFL